MAGSRASVVRERQVPLRKAYAERPAEAMTQKWARASAPADDPFHGTVEVGKGHDVSIRYGIDASIGGLHDAPNPGDLLCAALASCADGAIRMIADALAVTIESLQVEVSGRVDVRGTLAIDPRIRVGLQDMSCRVRLRPSSASDPGRVEQLLRTAEQACVTLDTLRRGTPVDVRVEIE